MSDPTRSRRFFHGTRADLRPGDLIQPGYSSNYTERRSPWVYFSETLHAATWGAELAKGEGPSRIYRSGGPRRAGLQAGLQNVRTR